MILVELFRYLKRIFVRKHILYFDNKKYKKVYAGLKNHDNVTIVRELLVYCHSIEKGLSHNNIKPLFGYDKVLFISKALDTYWKNGGRDSYTISTAIATIKEYNRVNAELNVPMEKMIPIPKKVTTFYDIEVGAKECQAKDLFDFTEGIFSDYVNHRHSVRLYDFKSLAITPEEILECVKIAQNSPNACNRQAVRVKIITNSRLISQLIEIQGGAEGFGENAGAIIIISSDISLYEAAERRIPMFDCGLFTMNLIYALLEKRIGACVLNGSFTLEREKEMQKVIPLPSNEMYSAVIALFKIPNEKIIKVTCSSKRNVEDIAHVIDNNL